MTEESELMEWANLQSDGLERKARVELKSALSVALARARYSGDTEAIAGDMANAIAEYVLTGIYGRE